ncbi:MAG: hypothetical protein RIM84_22225 [Alphaproteobacteria bacterium]
MQSRQHVIVDRDFVFRVLTLSIAMTTLAEVVYLLVWGIILFPNGPLGSKVVWTMTCGVAMGSVIGAASLIFATQIKFRGRLAICFAGSFLSVSAYCSVLCSQIDTSLSYFGGADHQTLFLLGGIVPATIGSTIHAWLLLNPIGTDLLRRIGL